MITCEIQVGYQRDHDYMVFAIDLDDVDTILAIDDVSTALGIVVDGLSVDDSEGEVFLDMASLSSVDAEERVDALQEFQQALHEWYHDNIPAIIEQTIEEGMSNAGL